MVNQCPIRFVFYIDVTTSYDAMILQWEHDTAPKAGPLQYDRDEKINGYTETQSTKDKSL